VSGGHEVMVEVEEKGGEGSITEGKMMGKRMRRISIFRVQPNKDNSTLSLSNRTIYFE
jgi:hypothetical protein